MKVKDVVVDMHQGINIVADKVEYLEEGIATQDGYVIF